MELFKNGLLSSVLVSKRVKLLWTIVQKASFGPGHGLGKGYVSNGLTNDSKRVKKLNNLCIHQLNSK